MEKRSSLYISRKEVVEMLQPFGITKRTLEYWSYKKDKLDFYKVKNTAMYLKTDVEDLIKNSLVKKKK